MTLGTVLRYAVMAISTDRCITDSDRTEKLDQIMGFVLDCPDLTDLDLDFLDKKG